MKINLNHDEISTILDCLQLMTKTNQKENEYFNKISINQVYNKLYSEKENGIYSRATKNNF